MFENISQFIAQIFGASVLALLLKESLVFLSPSRLDRRHLQDSSSSVKHRAKEAGFVLN